MQISLGKFPAWRTTLRKFFVQSALATCSILIAFLPLPLLFDVFFIRPGFHLMWLGFLLVLACFGAWLAQRIRMSNTVIKSIVISIILLFPSTLLAMSLSQAPLAVTQVFVGLMTVAIAIVAVTALRMVHAGWMTTLWGTGLVLQFASYFLFTYVHSLRPALPYLWVASLITIAMVYFSLNALYVHTTLSSKQTTIPRHVHVFNRVMVGALLIFTLIAFVALLFFVNLAAIESAILHWLAYLFASRHVPSQVHLHHSAPFAFKHRTQPPQQAGSDLWFRIIAIVFIAAFVALLVVALWRSMKALFSWMQRQRTTDEAYGYIDEVESLSNETTRAYRRRQSKMAGKDDAWERIASSEDKVRFLYRRCVRIAIQRGYSVSPSATAREHLASIRQNLGEEAENSAYLSVIERLETLYDPARYWTPGLGSESLVDVDLEQLWQTIQQVK